MVEKQRIMKVLKEKAIDPETGIDVVRMGMIKGVEVKGADVKINLSLLLPSVL